MEISLCTGVTTLSRLLGAAPPVAPVALNLLQDLTLEQDVAMAPRNLSTDFTGPDLTFALAPGSDALPTGLSLSASGVLSGTPTVLQGPLNIVVRATNPQASADSAFQITVLEMIQDFTATLSGLTANPTHGPSAEDGVALTAGGTEYSGSVPSTVAYQWKTLQSGPIAGATAATYTPSAALFDGETLYCTVTPAGYPATDTPTATIRRVPPVAAGALFDEILDVASGDEFYDVAGDFTGGGLTFSVSGPGTSINPATGRLTISSASPVAGASVIVTAVNTGGTATSAFTLTVEDADIGPGPDISNPLLEVDTDTVSLSVDVPCTIYWRRDPTATNPTADMVIAGGGYDSGSFAVSSGTNSVSAVFAPGNDGVQEISFVAAVTPSEPSLVQTVAIEIDTTDPVLVSSVPAAGTMDAASSVIPSLTFSEDVVAGTGVVTLYDVTGGAAVETFDVVADAGTGAGQVRFAGAVVTVTPSAALMVDRDYAILIDPGAVTDEVGNAFAGISSTGTLGFTTGAAATFDTEFGAAFTAEEPALWAAIQANGYSVSPEHRGTETWDAYPASLTDGGVVGVKGGNYPQLRFPIPVEIGKTYTIDADFPLGENTFAGPLRIKIGSTRDAKDYAEINETQAGQPRVVELRGQQITATTTELWFAVIVETSVGGANGGNPAISKLRVAEV
ncbi:MAG: putative Ig domain-containing protein [Pseudomonadota bacterium]